MIGRMKHWLLREGWIALLELALVAALAISLAHWTWVALAPGATAAPSVASQSAAPLAGRPRMPNLFGAPPERAAAGDGAQDFRVKLRGVISPSAADKGRAIFALENGKSTTTSPGEAIVPGVVLQEVHADHVLVSRDGATRRITLERRSAIAETSRRPR